MNRLQYVAIGTLFVLSFGLSTAYSAEGQSGPVTHSKDYERMKELAGTWEGSVDTGKGMETLKVTYEVTSAGNAVLERFAAGQPHEMVTVYHDRSGRLVMTHYCSIGNQPHMELTNPGETAMKFVLSKRNPGLITLYEAHMHALTITHEGKDSISHTWTLYDKGVKKSDLTIKLVRMKR